MQCDNKLITTVKLSQGEGWLVDTIIISGVVNGES